MSNDLKSIRDLFKIDDFNTLGKAIEDKMIDALTIAYSKGKENGRREALKELSKEFMEMGSEERNIWNSWEVSDYIDNKLKELSQ